MPKDVTSRTIGHFVRQPGGYRAFVPGPFPPFDEIPMSAQTIDLLAKATLSLGKLDGITELLPDLDFFIFMYVRKEAALSSQLEGTQATIADVIKAESDIRSGLPEDVDDIRHYIDAMNLGLARLTELPLSLRLIREVHRELLTDGRSTGLAYPGEFRTSQNWIGGGSPATARFVPPPPHEMHRALGDLEEFIHAKGPMPDLVKAGMIHAQFETIHPFVDGNGRTGRLLTTFFLCQRKILSKPVLYLSEYLKKNRESYFDLLHGYHDRAEIIPWLNFFLEGVSTVSAEAVESSRRITALRDMDMAKVTSLGRSAKSGMMLLRHLFRLPIVSVRNVEEATKLSRTNANKLVDKFVEVGILKPVDETVEYGRTFAYVDYLTIFAS